MAFSAGLTVDNFDLVAMDLTATVHDESIASSGLLVVSKSVLGELGMSIEELTEMYASFGMVTPIANGEKGIVALNGYENYDYIMGVAGFDASGNYVTCGSFSFHSDFADENLPLPGEMVIEVSEITESTARVQYIMGENTRAYYQSVMTVADYNDLLAYGASLPDDYDDPEDYVRDYVVNASGSVGRDVEPIEGTVFCSGETGWSLVTVDEKTLSLYMLDKYGKVLHTVTRTVE